MKFINREINRINLILGRNENINILFSKKHTKFEGKKYNKFEKCDNNSNIKDIQISNQKQDNKISLISDAWLFKKYNNCRYNAFITLFYFVFASYIKDLNDNSLKYLNQLNDLILKLSNDVNDKNYNEIIIFLQKNKFDSNNYLLDEIIREEDEDM